MKTLYADLEKKTSIAIHVIKKAEKLYSAEKTVVAWTGGKDSTVLLHIIKEAYKGIIPFPVMFNDSTMEFPEIYQFIKTISKQWHLNLVIIPHDAKELEEFHKTKDYAKKKELSRMMKVHAINNFIKRNPIKAFLVGIRKDEHKSRSNETYFSKRKDHVRVHPILDFTEKDIWNYIHIHNVPYVSLYNKGYRSLGEKPFTKKTPKGGNERSGREQEKENLMEKLRSIGYW